MRRQRKCLKRISAWALAAAMILGIALPTAQETAEAAETTVTGVNYAPSGTATASNEEAGTKYTADKAIDGDSTTASSRWGTDVNHNITERWLQVDLGTARTFNRFVIVWERTNIENYVVEISDTGADNNWKSVYTKADGANIESTTSEITLNTPETARYVRLRVTQYDGTGADTDWPSVSVYEFKIIADVAVVGDGILENLSLSADASASGSEDNNSFGPARAADGSSTTRWASAVRAANEANPHWLQLRWDTAQTIQTIRIHWERCNPITYSIQKSDDGSIWKDVKTFSSKPTDYRQTIELDEPVTTQYLRINITRFDPNGAPESGSSVPWETVSVYEFETYSYAGILETEEELTLQDVVDSLAEPEVNAEGTAVTLPKVEGYTIELLADYEQVVDRDGTIYKPLTEKTVKAIYKVTQGEGENAESVEGTTEYTLTIPGQNPDGGTNDKPTVIPELAEWYGGNGSFTIDQNATIYAPGAFESAANALADDYNAEMGTELTVATSGSANAGDIQFVVDEDNGLGEEGYIMEIGDTLTVKAEESTGAYWATRSILQIAKLNNGEIPQGETKDYPKYEVRSFSLDVARKPISMSTLYDIVKEMAYYKMNDFQVHLNDNLIFYEDYGTDAYGNLDALGASQAAYTGFRLESDIKENVAEGGENQADLTNEDLYYTKTDFRNFILASRSMGVNIVPEFDTPGHSGAFTKVRPDLILDQVAPAYSARQNRAGEQFNLAEGEAYNESLEFVKGLWNEYLTENMFDESMTVHIGTDEYYGDANRFRVFSNDMINYIQSKNRTVRIWGSLSSLTGTQEVKSDGVQLNVWNTGWAQPRAMYDQGFELINTIDGCLYMVPGAGYYFDYLNTESLYNNWIPNRFSNNLNDAAAGSGTLIPAGSDQMLGSTYAIWSDSIDTRANGISEVEIYDRFADAVPVMASKNWGEGTLPYAEVEAAVEKLGDAPNSNPYYESTTDAAGEYMSYKFESDAATEDSSDNNRDLTENQGVEFTSDGTLKLDGGADSYVTTPIEKLATGNVLEFDITLDTPPQAGDILFEADTEGNDDYAHTIQIMDDGRLGFRRELYDYYFDYKLPVGETVHLRISTNGTTTILNVDGVAYRAEGVYRNRQTDGEVRVEGITRSTLLLPLQRIGSKTNAIAAEIDNVVVSPGWSTESVSSETVYSSTEGLFEYAFDGNPDTIWHSNWNGTNDKLSDTLQQGTEGTLPTIEGVIDLGRIYTLDEFSFTPRVDSSVNGRVTKADLYLGVDDGSGGIRWTQVATDATFADDTTRKTFTFAETEARYVRFVAKQSNNGWVCVSEFDIGEAEDPTYTVYVDSQSQTAGEVTVSGDTTGLTYGSEVTVTAAPKEGYTFTGWIDPVTGAEVSDDAECTFNVVYNTALRATFEEKTAYTVTFSDGVESQKVYSGDKATRPSTDPTKAGHYFLGWFEEDSDTAFDFDQPITEDVTLTARFQAYTVTATADSGVTVSEMDDQGRVTVTASQREGYNFTGWMVNGTKVSAGLEYTFVPEADTTVEPVYEEIVPGVTYYKVTIGEQTIQVKENDLVNRPTDPSKPGYKFIGWYVGDKEYDFSQPVTSNLVIEARFEKIATPVGPGNPGDQNPDGSKTDKDEDKAVETGDVSNFAPWALFLVISAGAVVVLAKRKTNK